jgi:microcystin degradation protein MlrC
MRVAIAAFMHESNTFASTPTELRHFEEASLHYGIHLLPEWGDAHHEIGGFIQGCRNHDLEIVPILAAWATPGGAVTTETYEKMLADLLTGLEKAAPFDGLLLALHGAMVCDDFPSADGETMERVRKLLGPDLPIVLSLDMHANISERMVTLPDATVVYRTYPHLDQRERGLEAASLMSRILRKEVRPVQALRKVPLLIHIVQQYTGSGPTKSIMDRVREIADRPGILSASFAPGYIYADVPDMGAAAIVVADGDHRRAEEAATELAEYAFSLREELTAQLPSPEEAVREASQIPGLVSLMDCGDNIGGGGPGDSTILFAEILRQGLRNACVVLYDPEAVAACMASGEGTEISLEVGGKTDDRHGHPVPITGMIQGIYNGRFVELEPRHGGTRYFDQGMTAVIETDGGHTVMLNSLRIMPCSLRQLTSFGIKPEEMKVIVVKGATAPRAAYEPVSKKVIPVDTPGVTQAGPESFVYHRRPRPLFPLERDAGISTLG